MSDKTPAVPCLVKFISRFGLDSVAQRVAEGVAEAVYEFNIFALRFVAAVDAGYVHWLESAGSPPEGVEDYGDSA